jgi:hypothetical protein
LKGKRKRAPPEACTSKTPASQGAFYFTLANIDPALRSKLEAINLLMIFPFSLLKSYSFDVIMTPIMKDLEKLSATTGHMFVVCQKEYQLRGALHAMVGGTPAMATVGGFKEGVGGALRKCRHCMAFGHQIDSKVCIYNLLN